MVFLVKNRKSEHYHWILHIQISFGNKFQHKMEIWIIWTKFAPKGWKTEKMNITIEFCILELFTIANFIWNWQFFGPNLPYKYAVYMFHIHQTIYATFISFKEQKNKCCSYIENINFLRKTYSSMTKNKKTLSESEQMWAEKKRQFQKAF